MRIMPGSVKGVLLAPEPYLRLVFVLIGAAIALALGIADFTVLSLIAGIGPPGWMMIVAGILLIGGPLLIGVVPAVRQIEGVAANALLVVRFADGSPGYARSWPQRVRTLAWFVLHLMAGALPVAAVMGMIWLGGSWWTIALALVTLLITVMIGRALAALAPVLLGPSYADRLEQLAAEAAKATERNRLAREIHDSIGHALSLVTLQAAAARKLIDRDPAFAHEALATIETTSRSAVGDLDHLLGLLGDDQQQHAAPAPPVLDPGSLDDLVAAARAAGLTVEQKVDGDLTRLPILVAQEAYRIVQEGLTNALKYSADSTGVLRVSLRSDRLDIWLSNPVDHSQLRTGRGLRGIDERARTLGGWSSAGQDGGRWTLRVMIPAAPS